MKYRAYFDGSGTSSSETDEPRLTLGGLASDDSVWSSFDDDWNRILLSREPPAPFLHMRLAMHLRGPFRSASGWTGGKVDALLNDLAVYLSRLDKSRFRIFWAAVDRAAYRRLRAEGYDLPHAVDLCNRACPEAVLAWYVTKFPGVITPDVHFYFDVNEAFKGRFERKWQAEKKSARRGGDRGIFWSLIKTVDTASHEDSPGIQAADLVAWAVNRQEQGEGLRGGGIARILWQVIPATIWPWNEVRMRQKFRPRIDMPASLDRV
ncbi:MAG TPA: DUF3800 domain-containing protein [Terriglobales bacterium]|nr:DUF3800 domain-containing protein [Terriglobales bacterium]